MPDKEVTPLSLRWRPFRIICSLCNKEYFKLTDFLFHIKYEHGLEG